MAPAGIELQRRIAIASRTGTPQIGPIQALGYPDAVTRGGSLQRILQADEGVRPGRAVFIACGGVFHVPGVSCVSVDAEGGIGDRPVPGDNPQDAAIGIHGGHDPRILPAADGGRQDLPRRVSVGELDSDASSAPSACHVIT